MYRSFRLAGYRQYVYWMYQRLGRAHRVILPVCVVAAIRWQYPEPDNNYIGFLPVNEHDWPT